jgi:hypothetical protein
MLALNGDVLAAEMLAAEAAALQGVAGAQSGPPQARTFYPGALSPASATPIVIKGGEEFTGVNVEIRNATFAKISGRVISAIPASAYEALPARGQQAAVAAAADPRLQPLMDEVQKAQQALQEARGRLQEARGMPRGGPGNPTPAQRGLPPIQLQLFPRDRNTLVDPNTGNRSTTAQLALPNDGRFQMLNVPPGSYDLYASLPDNTAFAPQMGPGQGGAGRSFGRIPIEVRDSDIEDITITVHQGTDIPGRLIVDGRPTALPGTHITIQPDDSAYRVPVYQMVGRFEPQVGADGSFVIPAVPEAAYRVDVTFGGLGPAQRGRGVAAGLDQNTVQAIVAQAQATGGNLQQMLADARGRIEANAPAPNPNAYVADVRQNGVSIYDTGFAVGAADVHALDVFVNTNGGGVTGTVVGPDQKPVAGARVVLVPPAQRRRNPSLFKSATSGADGRFNFTGLPPGEFKLFAWQSMNGEAYRNPTFLAPFEERGVGVSIFAGGQLTTEVPVIAQ